MSLYSKMKSNNQMKKNINSGDMSISDYNLDLLAKIQPRGGVNYKNDFYVKKGTGHEACITIYETPTDVEDFWLGQLMTMDNTIVTMDMKTKTREEIKNDLKTGMTEYLDRMNNDRDIVARSEAQEAYYELDSLLRNIRNGGESIKEVVLRMYVSGRTRDEVDEKINEIMIFLNSMDFKGTVYLNEQKFESQALTMSLTQQDAILPRIKKDIPAQTIATGVPFHSVSLNDPRGVYFGVSDTGGNIILDLFHKDNRRTSYDGVLVGTKGAGKSHTLKKILLEESIQGNRVRTIDSTGEFVHLVNVLGGKTISLDGTDGMINPLEVNAVAVKEKTDDLGQNIQEVDEVTSFNQHKQKLSTFYGLMNPDASEKDKQLFRIMIHDFYRDKGLWSANPEEQTNITNLKSEEYPTFSELLQYLREILYKDDKFTETNENVTQDRVSQYQAIELTLLDIIASNGRMFDGHTTIENFKEHQIINFSIRQLNSMGDEVKKAQLFNVMNLLFDEMVYFGSPQFQAYNRKELELDDAVRYRLIFDEAHNLISANETDAPVVEKCEKFIREDRKYFAGFIFASQDIKDFIPEDSQQENIAKVKTLFSQATYRFIMRQDTSNVEKLGSVFSQELSDSELGVIPQLGTGEAILNIAGLRNVKFRIETTEEEDELFGGGA
ncbi:VirB4 family type IV secretion system protein [Staphylococcus saprophyticus]|jgi:hypothetical protein|uniref:VirB4 family type IV secretion system protein n=1 Tax=Staphylococcus saprophyticus TaxID=29385 RepID=UPI001642BE13|nr:hypothetical protein [Staphylococcus saprophyticus]MBC2921962.1 hypothetical protein [Staphylococcus saprophyticus]MBC2958515.1 hypothetical protein [Staphylococcus saprophyticus]MBC3010402.1 hypothetical protein [Staphylococcus saprophyticus]MBC3024281.1 hypothetical protein [Staphylococcus saprophyticus]MBC3031508.1 hypothetical protein [Staphylococcus saprophyticus]